MQVQNSKMIIFSSFLSLCKQLVQSFHTPFLSLVCGVKEHASKFFSYLHFVVIFYFLFIYFLMHGLFCLSFMGEISKASLEHPWETKIGL
jgi:hypothetical protein